MTFEEAKHKLRDEYIKVGFTLTDEHDEELFFKYNEKDFKIDKDEIVAFQTITNNKAEYETHPSECSIVSKNYREQIINYLHPRSRFMPPRYRQIFFGENNGTSIYIEISQASNTFINYFRFNEQYLEICLDGPLRWGARYREHESFALVGESLFHPMTIKVYNINESSIKLALSKSSDIIDSCIFTLSTLKELPIELVDAWPLRRKRTKSSKDFEFGETIKGSQLPIPKIRINPVLVHFHQQATSTDIPSLKYLAFYQILEYFYLSVSDENLYINLTRRINDLKFKTTPHHLDKIIQDVITHKRENDETEMLKNVIKKFVDEGEIIQFITDYEKFMSKKIYTAKRVVFGQEISPTNLTTGHVFGNIAKTIKAIRNALVHSSDRYERNDRYIPYSKEGTDLIETELPLIKFLADKVIIGSSEAI